MKRIILFSVPFGPVTDNLFKKMFPEHLPNKVFAYMPANGSDTKQKFTDFWKDISVTNNAEFLFIDNSLPEEAEESKKIERANILLISGGNTFELLHNLRQSKLDEAVKKFVTKDEFVLAGFSAGAIVLTPTIKAASIPTGDDPTDMIDENTVGITNLTGLSIVDFEVMPHFGDLLDKKTIDSYKEQTQYSVRTITNDEMIVLDL